MEAHEEKGRATTRLTLSISDLDSGISRARKRRKGSASPGVLAGQERFPNDAVIFPCGRKGGKVSALKIALALPPDYCDAKCRSCVCVITGDGID